LGCSQAAAAAAAAAAMGQQQAIKTFFVTLRRSQIGKPWFHRQVLDGLGLKKRLLCIEKPNNPVIRGMLRKVSAPACRDCSTLHCNEAATALCSFPFFSSTCDTHL
jgi:ribosomal protein L30